MELFIVILLFVVGSILNAAGKKKRGAERGQGESDAGGEEPAQPDLLGEIRRALEEMKRAQQEGRPLPEPRRVELPPSRRPVMAPRPASVPIADEEEVEEGESLEVEPEVRSLEDLTPRAARQVVDQDDGVEALVAKRHRWAEEHGRRKTMAEHREFDRRIRESTPAPTPAPLDAMGRLRQRIVWAEILDKPLALRDQSRR